MSPKIKQSREGATPFVPYSRYSKKVFFEYSPGETSFQLGYLGADKSTIEGVLHLRYSDDKPIFAKKITLSFVGKEYVFFKGTLEEGQDIIKEDDESGFYDNEEDVSTTTISTHTAKRKFFGSNLVIWRSQSKGHYEGVKYLNLPFKFNLPNNLPPSVVMDQGCGRIYYMLKAVISRRTIDPNSTNKKKIIKVIVPVVHFTMTPKPDNFRWFAKEEGQAKAHVVGYDVSLTRSIFQPGESINIPIKLFFHEPHAYLKKIFVGLKEYHELRTDKYETLTKKYISEEIVQANVISISSLSDNECSVEINFKMPSARQLVYSVDSTYLTVSHKLKFKFSLGRAPDIHLSKFVKIDKIVSEEEVFPPIPPAIEIPQAIVTHEPIIVKPKRESLRRLSPFFPLFDKIQNKDLGTKRISLQLQKLQLQQLQLQIRITDSKNPNMIYNSRSLTNNLINTKTENQRRSTNNLTDTKTENRQQRQRRFTNTLIDTKTENHQQQRQRRFTQAY